MATRFGDYWLGRGAQSIPQYTEVVIKDGSTVIHRGYAAAGGGGYSIDFPTPLRGTAATALNVACITTGSATVVSASGFSAAE